MTEIAKTFLKIGEMVIDPRQIFWKREYVFASIPFIQILQGHIQLTTQRRVLNYKDLQLPELVELSITTSFIVRCLQQLYGCTSTTIHIQNSVKNSNIGQFLVHVVPRKAGDVLVNDDIYKLLDIHPLNTMKVYSERLGPGLPEAQEYLTTITPQATQLQQFIDMKFKEIQATH